MATDATPAAAVAAFILILHLQLLSPSSASSANLLERRNHDVRVFRSICEKDAYWDGVDRACVECREICQPHLSVEFCQVNCPDYMKRQTLSKSNSALLITTINAATTSTTSKLSTVDLVPVDTSLSVSPFLILLAVLSVVCISLSTALVIVFICVRKFGTRRIHSTPSSHDQMAIILLSGKEKGTSGQAMAATNLSKVHPCTVSIECCSSCSSSSAGSRLESVSDEQRSPTTNDYIS